MLKAWEEAAGTGVRTIALLGALLGCADEKSPAPAAANTYDTAILGFVAAHVYHDFPSLEVKRGSKFEVFMLPTVKPEQVRTLRVHGPGGFVFDFMNVPFRETANGYLENDRIPVLWYQAFRTASLEPGSYSVHVTFENGVEKQSGREVLPNQELIEFYLEHKHEMLYTPSGGVSPANDTLLTWTTLRDLGGPDAYYNAWISPGTAEAIDPETARGDLIFGEFTNPSAGLNASSSRQGSADNPLPIGPQTWHPEITDSNRLDRVGVALFPPGQHFTAQ